MVLLLSAAIVLAIYSWSSLWPDTAHAVFARLPSLPTRGVRPALATESVSAPARLIAPTRGIYLSYGIGIAASLFCALISAWTVAAHPLTAQTWWFVALVIAPGAIVLARWSDYRTRARVALRHIPPFDIAVIAALCLVSLLLRLPNLDTLIPFVHGDEAACGIYGRLFNSGQAPLLSIGWYGLPMLSYAIPGLGLQWFGDTLHGLRLSNVVLGTVGIVLTYLLGRELFGRRAGLLAGAVLAFSFLDMDLSRDGIHYIQAPTAITLSLYLLARWLRKGGVVTPLLAGMSFAISLQVYFAARIVFPIVAVFLVLIALFDPHLRRARLNGVVWIGLGFVIAVLPLVALFMANPGSFSMRQNDVSLFNALADKNTLASLGYSGQSTLNILWTQAVATVSTFYSRGDAADQIGWGGSIVDTVSGLILPFALVLCLVRVRRWPYALCLLWFSAVLAAGVLTVDPPWWPRLSAMIPAVALMLGVAMDTAGGWAARRTGRSLVAVAGLAALLVMIAIGNMRVMFVEYPAASQSVPRRESTIVGLFLARTPGADQTILVSDGFFNLRYEPIRFLAPRAGGCTVEPNQAISTCAAVRSPHIYIFLPGRVKDLQGVSSARPGGRIISLGDASAPMFAYLPPST